jgi:hypothetical protein
MNTKIVQIKQERKGEKVRERRTYVYLRVAKERDICTFDLCQRNRKRKVPLIYVMRHRRRREEEKKTNIRNDEMIELKVKIITAIS